jgi:hypothetical protein
MAILPEAIYMFNIISIKIPMTFFTKIHMETQKTSNSQTILSKISNAGTITISNFKLYYRAITIKTAWNWNKNRQEDQ